jgi:hypothetical protein
MRFILSSSRIISIGMHIQYILVFIVFLFDVVSESGSAESLARCRLKPQAEIHHYFESMFVYITSYYVAILLV